MHDVDNVSVDIPVPWSKAPIVMRGLSLLLAIQMVLQAITAWAVIDHSKSSTTDEVNIAVALREIAASNREVAREQRLMACILATGQEKRSNEFMSPNSMCRQLSIMR